MNAKKLFLGLMAIVFAVGTAYASLMTPVTYYVRAFNGTWSCEPVTIDPDICDLLGSSNCQIKIQLVSGTGMADAHPDNLCTQTRKDNSINNTAYPLNNPDFQPVQVAN
ncbi:MAG: DUF6520 family protein [Chryseosolibacter sp.]